MRPRWWQFVLGILVALVAFCGEGGGGGIGISTPPESPDTVLVSPCLSGPVQALFFPTHVGIPPRFRSRDLEFLWDSLYSGARGYVGFSQTDLALLDSLGTSIADNAGVNPFGAPYTDIRLVHDYFNDHNATYDADGSHPYGFFIGTATDPPPDRAHVDCYIPVVGHAPAGGATPSGFFTAKEDSSTLHWGRPGVPDTVYHCNSLMVTGPPVSDVANPAWARPDYEVSGNFNHEFQHAMDLRTTLWTEMFSSGAEAVAGHRPVATIVFDVPYTWPVFAYGGSCFGRCTTEVRCVGSNYQGWRLFTAYLAYNFRGRDTTAVLPSGPTVGFGDDLLYRWAHGASANLTTLKNLLSDQNCYPCSTAAYFHPGGVPLDNHSRLGLLLHNWRVANYVNNSSLTLDRQYGYPPQFGFKPWLDVGAWQSIDACGVQNDIVAIPPEVTLSTAQTTAELTRVGTRMAGGGSYSYPMALQPFGSEYWVVRSDASLSSGGQDLVVRVTPEGIHRDYYPGLFEDPNCFVSNLPAQADARLIASVIGYAQQDLAGQPDSLWKHPEWASLALAPQWVDVDSTAGTLEFVVPGFGSTNKAVVVVLSLADGPSGYYTTHATDGLNRYREALPYRITLALRKAPYDTPNPGPISQQGGSPDDYPTWSPAGTELAFEATIAGQSSVRQVYRRNVSGGTPVPVAQSPLAQRMPDWSPRGDWIAFVDDNTELHLEQSRLVLANMNTGETRVVAGAPLLGIIVPTFSPNGQQVAYAQSTNPDSGPWEIRRVDLNGGNSVALANIGLGGPASLRWSPSGGHIYFTRNDSVFAIPKEGGQTSRCAGCGNNVASFDFRPGSGVLALEEHGQSIAWRICTFINPGSQESTLVAMPFRRLALRDTTSGDTQARFYRTGVEFFRPRWSPDGTRIAYSATQSTLGDRDLFVGQVSYNHAPTFSPPLRDTALALPCPPYTFAFDLAATDPDGETVTYQAAYLPPGATLAGNHFSWANPGPPGSDYYVVFRALDGAGGVGNKVVKFTLLPDLARPAAANDVTLQTALLSGTVTWTAPGDDSLVGQACRFDVRWSTSPITESNFSSLPDTLAADLPGPAGTIHCAQINALWPCKWYYAALKTCDDAGRWSALSNVSSSKTCTGDQDISCEGGMFAQGGGGGGWSTENALLDQAPLGQLSVDGYQLAAGLQPEDGKYQVRLLKTGAGGITLDEVGLAAVDHPATTRAFLSGGRMVLGTAAPVYRVTDGSGQDVTAAFSGGAGLPYVGTPGEALLIQLNQAGSAGEALQLETAAGGPAASADSSGILIQTPANGGGWGTVAWHHPRRRFDRFLADSLGSGTVRLLFLGEHQVRFLGRVAKTGAANPQRLTLLGASHSRLGDVAAAVSAAGGTAATLGPGDALTLGFAAPPLSADRVREWALIVRGTKVNLQGAMATRVRPATADPPASFALYQNQPNPFATTTTFRFDLPRPETVRLEVFDLVGRRVATVRDAWLPAGRHSVEWNSRDAVGSPVRPGAYVYRLSAGSFRAQRKLVVLP